MRTALVVLVLAGCETSLWRTDELSDMVPGATVEEMLALNVTAGILEAREIETGHVLTEVVVGGTPERMAFNASRGETAIVHGEDGESRLDIVNHETGSGVSVPIGAHFGIDVAWGEGAEVFVLAAREQNLSTDVLRVDADLGQVVGTWPVSRLDFYANMAWSDGALFLNENRFLAEVDPNGDLILDFEAEAGGFTGVSHRASVTPDGSAFLWGASSETVNEFDGSDGSRLSSYVMTQANRLFDFTYTSAGDRVLGLVWQSGGPVVWVFPRGSDVSKQLVPIAPLDITLNSNMDRAFVVASGDDERAFIVTWGNGNGLVQKVHL